MTSERKILQTKNHISNVGEILEKNLSPKITEAYNFAREQHGDRKRFSGNSYLSHVVETADILLTWIEPDKITPEVEEIIIGGLLHDTIEYEETSPEEIETKFGETIKKLVVGLSDLRSDGSIETEKENLRYVADNGSVDARVFIVKLADRLHNMRTLDSVPKEKQVAKAKETMDVYVPLTESMGIWEVKRELEDLAFKFIDPLTYAKTKDEIDFDPRIDEHAFENYFKSELVKIMNETHIDFDLEVTKNSYWQIYQKRRTMAEKGLGFADSFSKVNDIISFRVISKSENKLDLYTLLGKLHTTEPYNQFLNSSRDDDFVAKPQHNGYQALQTTLDFPVGSVEVSFVTQEMEDFNKYGVVNYLKNGQSEKLDEYKRIIVFNSDLEAKILPVNANYLDYAISCGHDPRTIKISVDNIDVNLTDQIKNAAIISITPVNKSKVYLDEAITNCLPETQIRLRELIEIDSNQEIIEAGKNELEHILRPRGLFDFGDINEELLQKILFSLGQENLQTLYHRLGSKNITAEFIENGLNNLGITKDNLNLSSIRLFGINKPGLLLEVLTEIQKFNGDVNQVRVINSPQSSDGTFSLRLVIKDLKSNELEQIQNKLSENSHLNKIEIA